MFESKKLIMVKHCSKASSWSVSSWCKAVADFALYARGDLHASGPTLDCTPPTKRHGVIVRSRRAAIIRLLRAEGGDQGAAISRLVRDDGGVRKVRQPVIFSLMQTLSFENLKKSHYDLRLRPANLTNKKHDFYIFSHPRSGQLFLDKRPKPASYMRAFTFWSHFY
jgi:hypothetical protein